MKVIEMPNENGVLLNDVNLLKSLFFDLMMNETDTKSIHNLYRELINIIKQATCANIVRLYLYNKWKDCYFLEEATTPIDKQSQSYSLSNEYLNELKEKNTANSIVLATDCLTGMKNIGTSYVILLKKRGTPQEEFGFIYLDFSPDGSYFKRNDFLEKIGVEAAKLVDVWMRYFAAINEESRYKQLYRVTAKFHSSMDMDEVLAEVIQTLQEVYPTFDYVLLLSHDTTTEQGLPIRDLQYGFDSANSAAAQAYLTGTIQFEDSLTDRKSVLYAPMKGRQGIYGVLQVTAPNTLVFPKKEVGFIELLANTAGSALENAQLYQQSRNLISDLQLINKTTHRLNMNLRLTDTINFMTEQIRTLFDAEEIGFLFFRENDQYKVLTGSSDYFFTDDAKILLNYINDRVKQEKDAIFIGDLSVDENIMEKVFRSLMVVPMIQSNLLVGAVYVLNKEPYHFSFDKFKLLQSLIHHTTLAFTNSMLREKLEKMVITDHLTKLYNRKYLDEKIQQAMNTDAQGVFLLLDIDNFKSINDTYGHKVGDDVIVQVANIIKRNIRSQDIAARWGGEELAVYLPRADLETGIMVAERLVKKVEMDTNPKTTISCGAAVWNQANKASANKLFNRADEALYKAKQTGKNKVIIDQIEI